MLQDIRSTIVQCSLYCSIGPRNTGPNFVDLFIADTQRTLSARRTLYYRKQQSSDIPAYALERSIELVLGICGRALAGIFHHYELPVQELTICIASPANNENSSAMRKSPRVVLVRGPLEAAHMLLVLSSGISGGQGLHHRMMRKRGRLF